MQDFIDFGLRDGNILNLENLPWNFENFWICVESFYKESWQGIAHNFSNYELQLYKNAAIHNSKLACQYAIALDQQMSELESIIAKDAEYSYYYAKFVLKDRFILGEYAISQNSYYSYLYAEYVLNGQFEMGEEAIARDADASFCYAKYVLKSRFILGEPAICSVPFIKHDYETIFNIAFDLRELNNVYCKN